MMAANQSTLLKDDVRIIKIGYDSWQHLSGEHVGLVP